MAPIKSFSNENGFTLIETMMAIAIMAIGLLAVAALQATAISGNAKSKKNSMAILLAEDQIETYKMLAMKIFFLEIRLRRILHCLKTPGAFTPEPLLYKIIRRLLIQKPSTYPFPGRIKSKDPLYFKQLHEMRT